MNKYRVVIADKRIYEGFYRTIADAAFGCLRKDEFNENQSFDSVSVCVYLIEQRVRRSTSGCARVG